jgi:hypothetical protein
MEEEACGNPERVAELFLTLEKREAKERVSHRDCEWPAQFADDKNWPEIRASGRDLRHAV